MNYLSLKKYHSLFYLSLIHAFTLTGFVQGTFCELLIFEKIPTVYITMYVVLLNLYCLL